MDPKFLNRIRQSQALPTLPAVAVQVLELVRNPNCQIPQLARVISKDPALASKILRTVNSSIYARPKRVSRLTQALALLGLQTVRILVLGFTLAHNLKKYKNKGFRPLDYWRRAIYSATAALTLAQRMHLELVEEAFIAALLMDVGMLALDGLLGDQYDTIHARARTHADVLKLEESLLHTNHAEVSGVLADIWGLPELLSAPMAHHHSAAALQDPSLRQLAEVCYLAGRCADVFVEESAAGAITELREYCHSKFAMTHVDCDGLLDQISRRTGEIAPLFEVRLNTDVSLEEILKSANDSVIQLTLESQQQARRQAGFWQPTAAINAATGLTDRGNFESSLLALFGAGGSLAVLLVSVDRLGAIGAEHGDDAAAAAFGHVAGILTGAAAPADLAARYSGEQLALAIPGAGRPEALARAQALRRRVADKPVDSGRLTVPVTITIGVATVEPACPFKEPAHLLKAAELALDAGRHAGGNCVRAFSPHKPLSGQSSAA